MKGNKILFMSQPSLTQQGQNGNSIPSLIGQPLIPIDISSNFTSYTQMNKQIVSEVLKNKKHLSSSEEINLAYKNYSEKCPMHQKKLSDKCRKCKLIISNIKNSSLPSNKPESETNQTTVVVSSDKDSNYSHMQSSTVSGNLNSLLLNNILSCQYFKEVVLFKNFNELITEIKNNVTNIEAWAIGISGVPSTFFCCFYRLIHLNLSSKEIKQLLNSSSIFVKISGLLYLRYLSDWNYLYEYLSPFLNDQTLFYPTVDKKRKISIGEYVTDLFKEYNHYGTRLPRIPIQIERDIRMRLLCHEEEKKREESNIKNLDKLTKGRKVKIYSFNDVRKGIINDIGIKIDINSSITVDVNGEKVKCSLGEIELMSEEEEEEGEEKSEESRKKRHRRRSRSREKYSLIDKVKEDEKKTALAHGKEYATKPTSFKKSISVKVPGMRKKRLSREVSPVNEKSVKKEVKSVVEGPKEKVNQTKKEEHTEEFLKRKEMLMKQYEKEGSSLKDPLKNNKNLDYIGPEMVKLG